MARRRIVACRFPVLETLLYTRRRRRLASDERCAIARRGHDPFFLALPRTHCDRPVLDLLLALGQHPEIEAKLVEELTAGLR